jgi:hypothetical protein
MFISATLAVSVESGNYGRFIKIKRGEKWIGLSASLWDILHAKPLTHIGQIVYLSRKKYVEVIEYNGHRYVSFTEVSPFQGIDYKRHINFNCEEWSMLLNKLPGINKQLHCTQCKKTQVHLREDGRVKFTRLNKQQYARVVAANANVQNQMGLACTYCGDEGIGCHCHKFDCAECEPDNFCQHCEALVLEAI